MARTTKVKTAPKGRVLTPNELELSEALQKALTGKATAEAILVECQREIGRLTQEINKLDYGRILVIWGEVREKLGVSPAPTREQLVRGT